MAGCVHPSQYSVFTNCSRTMTLDKLIDLNDLAGILKIPAKTIRNKLSDGSWELPPLRIGKALRWSDADVNAYLSRLKARSMGNQT